MSDHLYFAYGSNLSSLRLQARLSSVRVITTARLQEHKLSFHMPSKDGSAKCDAHFTGEASDLVWGVIYKINPSEKPTLDHYEGLGDSYETKTVKLLTMDGQAIEAFTYYALRTGSQLRPYCWYLEHVVRGAREHRLPDFYINRLIAVAIQSDADSRRRNTESAIYSG